MVWKSIRIGSLCLFGVPGFASLVDDKSQDFAYYRIDRSEKMNEINLANQAYIYTEEAGLLSWQTVRDLDFEQWNQSRAELTPYRV